MDCIICRYGEIALKGKNRHLFEQRLVTNIKDCLKQNSVDARVEKVRGRIFVHTTDNDVVGMLQRVFGLVSVSPAVIVENDLSKISSVVVDYVGTVIGCGDYSTFRISCRRANKKFSKNSNEVEIAVGSDVNVAHGLGVKLKDPDLDVGIEVHDVSYIFHEKFLCPGGLPLGMGGNVACFVRGNSDVLAAWMFMKRGCEVHFGVSSGADVSVLSRYAYGVSLDVVEVGGLDDMSTIIENKKCKALVIGDLFDEFDLSKYDVGVPVLAPLVGYDTKEVADMVSRI